MNIGLISKRYAKALLESATENGCADRLYQEMRVLERTLKTTPELVKAMRNPTLGLNTKRLLLSSVHHNPSEIYLRFVDLVLKNRRESQLRNIALRFQEFYRASIGENAGVLITAVPAEKDVIDRIHSIFSKVMPGRLELETKVDESIGGGFIFDFDTYRLDASVRSQLNAIKNQLIAENNRRG